LKKFIIAIMNFAVQYFENGKNKGCFY